MNCAGCNLEIRREKGYASFTYGTGTTALEQLRSHRCFRYCGDCARAMRSWLGLPNPPDIPEPPFSLCSDPRLELTS